MDSDHKISFCTVEIEVKGEVSPSDPAAMPCINGPDNSFEAIIKRWLKFYA